MFNCDYTLYKCLEFHQVEALRFHSYSYITAFFSSSYSSIRLWIKKGERERAAGEWCYIQICLLYMYTNESNRI
jgi:hypothetical protein